MRDVLETADAVHSDAMSEMVGSRSNDDHISAVNVHPSAAGSVSGDSDGGRSTASSVEVDWEGGRVLTHLSPVVE